VFGVYGQLLNNIDLLRESFRLSRSKYNYKIEAIVILPEHFHMIITPKIAKDYPKIISHIKRSFLYGLDKDLKNSAKIDLSSSKLKRQHSGIWQSRYHEHTIRDEKDFKIRFDYIHFNPVKHKLVSKVNDWEYSSFHKYIKMGWYDSSWCDFDENLEFE
jgi:putative transposase